MCGIGGIFAYSDYVGPVELSLLKVISKSMSSRGPDHANEWISKDKKIGLVHRRLSIIDLSSEANQPMFNAMQSLSDHYLEEAYSAAVDSIEEAILNAVIAAETMTFVKPSGYQAKAIDHDRLQTILKKYNRLA